MPDEFQTLVERRNWLAARIMAKKSVGWETQYDEREHRALNWALGLLEIANTISGSKCPTTIS